MPLECSIQRAFLAKSGDWRRMPRTCGDTFMLLIQLLTTKKYLTANSTGSRAERPSAEFPRGLPITECGRHLVRRRRADRQGRNITDHSGLTFTSVIVNSGTQLYRLAVLRSYQAFPKGRSSDSLVAPLPRDYNPTPALSRPSPARAGATDARGPGDSTGALSEAPTGRLTLRGCAGQEGYPL